jgi:aldose 1-epimerase
MVRIREAARLDGGQICEATLQNADMRVTILGFGAITRAWQVMRRGKPVHIVLGYQRVHDYFDDDNALGIIAGRVANRTARGRLPLGGRIFQLARNEGANHLHGGVRGLGKRCWAMEADSTANAVRLSYFSPDGEEGYPGSIAFAVIIRLGDSSVTYEMTGQPDRDTPVNLAQHSYYNLTGGGTVMAHRLRVPSHFYTPVDGEGIPLGGLRPVESTRFDFRTPAVIAEADPQGEGIDVNLALDDADKGRRFAAQLWEAGGLTLKVWSDQPGLQVYDGRKLRPSGPGHGGAEYGPNSGLCLEPQHFPDSINRPEFPSVIATPESPYRQNLLVQVAEELA